MHRHLYIASTEFIPFAQKSGLAEFNGLARALQQKNIWASVSLIMPHYLGMHAQTTGGIKEGLRHIFISIGDSFGAQVNEGGRVVGDLPPDEAAWEQFADQTIAAILNGFGQKTMAAIQDKITVK